MNGPVIHQTSPQISQPASISSTMLDVIIALLPALAMAVFLFGLRVLALTAVSVGTCVLAEYGYRRIRGQKQHHRRPVRLRHRPSTGYEPSGHRPLLGPCAGRAVRYRDRQAVLRRLGRNFLNPALAGRTLLCTFPGLMTSWVDASSGPA